MSSEAKLGIVETTGNRHMFEDKVKDITDALPCEKDKFSPRNPQKLMKKMDQIVRDPAFDINPL